MPTEFNGRMLLASSLEERFPQQVVLVTIQYDINNASVDLIAPGLVGDQLAILRRDLYLYLQGALDIDPKWAWDCVDLDESSAPEPKITVTPNLLDQPLGNDESEDLILNVTRTYMTVRAKMLGLKAIVLTGRQVYVPLKFELVDMLDSLLEVALPKELLARQHNFPGHNVKLTDAAGYNPLQKILSAILRARGYSWHYLHTYSSCESGLKISICFDGFNPPKPSELNNIEQIICWVLGMYAFYPGEHDELVFQPVDRHQVNPDADAKPAEVSGH